MLASARTAYLGFALGALVAALPQPATHSPTSRHHRQSQRKDLFSLAMQVDGTYFPLVAVNNGTADLVLQAATDEGVKHGTPAYTNTTTSPSTNTNGYNTSLVLDLTAQDSHDAGCAPGGYGVAVADPGDLYGISLRVNAVLGYQEFDFAIVDGTVYHSFTSGLQHWFACLDTVNGTQGYFLSWGVFTEADAAPDGCVVTSVVQKSSNSTATARSVAVASK